MKRAYITSRTSNQKYYLADLAKELGFDDEYCKKFDNALEDNTVPDMRLFDFRLKVQRPDLVEEFKGQETKCEWPKTTSTDAEQY